MSDQKKTRPAPWSPVENRAVCALYELIWLDCMEPGRGYTKAARIREAQAGELSQRSRGSIEAKLMNVTAALESLGAGFVEFSLSENGYRPLPNMQAALKAAVRDYFDPAHTQPVEGDEARA